MSGTAQINLVCLVDDEIRAAAQAMKMVGDAAKADPDNPNGALLRDALNAAWNVFRAVAENPEASIVVIAGPKYTEVFKKPDNPARKATP